MPCTEVMQKIGSAAYQQAGPGWTVGQPGAGNDGQHGQSQGNDEDVWKVNSTKPKRSF